MPTLTGRDDRASTAVPPRRQPPAPAPRRRERSGRAAAAAPAGPPGPAAAPAPPAPKRKGPRHAPPLTRLQVLRRQRRRRRRILIGSIIFLIVGNLIVGFGATYVRWRIGQINRIVVPELAPENAKDEVMNVLVVGSDSRARLTGQAAAQAGKSEVGGERSDTIMILHIDPERQRAAILSIPRDTYVPITGTNGSDRINTAFSIGGASGLIATLRDSLGIDIHHYVEVDFVGFKEIVDAVGGVSVYLSAPAKDDFSLLELYESGCIKLNGEQGLAWVRSRHYESYVNGGWQPDPRADLGRIERQQDFIRRMLRKAVSEGLTNPFTLNRLIGIGVDNVTIDEAMSTSDITRIARRFSNLDPERVEMLTLPTTGASINGASVLELRQPDAGIVIDRINGIVPQPTPQASPPPTAPPTTAAAVPLSDTKLKVLNGNGVKGAASRAATEFTRVGFTVGATGDAEATFARTVVRHAPGQRPKAELIDSYLLVGSDIREDATLRDADAVVVVGTDYAGVRAAPLASPTTALEPTIPAPASAIPSTVPRPHC